MRVFVTGATGFLGGYVVSAALRHGHTVRAVVRSAPAAEKLGWTQSDRLEFAHVDLRSREGLVEALAGVDCVLHLAAQKAGDIYTQFHGTVVTTENLLWAMGQAAVRHIVHASTFSVYDYLGRKSWSLIDENAPLEPHPFDRDEYAQSKLVQEELVVTTARQQGWRHTVLRPGMIYGRDNLWSARLGVRAGRRLWIRTGAWARLPLNYVENCADAIVLAAEKPEAEGQIFNVVDDEMPRQRNYVAALQARVTPRPRVVPVSWTIMRMLARLAWLTNTHLLGGRAKIPSILSPAKLHARLKPMVYTNAKIKRLLGWEPRYGLNAALDRSLGHNWIEVVDPTNGLPVPDAPGAADETAKPEGAA